MTRHEYPAPSYDDPPARVPVYDAEYIECCTHDCNQGRTCPQRRRYVDAGWLLGLGIVACVSGMVALVMLMWGMW